MKECDKKCENCVYYKAVYTRGWNCFFKHDVGLCFTQKKLVSIDDCCKKWKRRPQQDNLRIQRDIDSIPEMLAKLTAIEETLKEHKN